MAFDPDAKLSDVLASGYDLNNQLQALLSRPLDSRGQEVAMAFSQELSRVFLVSLSMLNSNSSVAPEVRTGNSSGVSTPAKEKRARYILITEGARSILIYTLLNSDSVLPTLFSF